MPDFSDLKAVFVNCSLKKDPDQSHTGTLMSHAAAVTQAQGVAVDAIQALAHDIAFGMSPDMTGHGWAQDASPSV